MALPPVDEKTRAFGASGYKGANAKELARLAAAKRDVVMTDEVFLTVCTRMVRGEPLVRICGDTTMPSQPQVMEHMFNHEAAREMYYAAREMMCETLAEETLTIADDDSDDHSWVGGKRFSHNEVVQRARVQIDTRRFVMQSMSPKRFGNKNVTEIQGNPDQPVVLQVVTGVPRSDTSLVRGEIVAPKIIEGTVVQKSIKDAE